MSAAEFVVTELLKKLDDLIKEALIFAESYEHSGGECPIMTEGFDHYDYSKMLTGIGKWRWRCPFCGMEFED